MFLFFRIRKKERRGVLELTISKDSRTSSPCVLDAHINNLRRIIMSRKKSTGEKEFAVMRFTFILPENIVENKLIQVHPPSSKSLNRLYHISTQNARTVGKPQKTA